MSSRLLWSIFFVGSVACSSHTGSRKVSAGDAGDGESGDELVCPVSASGKFQETPTGACVGAGSCAIELDNSCRPGINAVPSTPAVYECQCIATQWQCVVASGGLGLIPCSDAGVPDP
jgi:hypothetical protein